MPDTKHRTPNVAAMLVLVVAAAVSAAPPTSPFVRLYDTGKASPKPLPPAAVAKRTGWKLVPESDRKHRFIGDAVFANDKLALVLRRGGSGARVHSLAAGKWKQRSLLAPCAAANDPAAARASLAITENTPAAVTLAATFRTKAGKPVSAAYRLTTGMPIAEFRAGKGTQRLRVADAIRHLVVPELLAIDVVLSPEFMTHAWQALPTENILLALLDGQGALATIVWPSGEQSADALRHRSRKDAFGAAEIECPQGKQVWYGLLEAEEIWRDRAIEAADLNKPLRLPWRPPFAARWRSGFAYADGYPTALDIAANMPAAQSDAGVWLEQDVVCARVHGLKRASGLSPKHVVLYPIDRNAATPLTTYCPVDIMRNALGVGVCQYVLDTEGMGDSAEATPAQVAAWLERTFRRRNAAGQAEAVRKRLDALARYARQVNDRHVSHVELGGRLANRCKQAEGVPSLASVAKELGEILEDMAWLSSEWAKDDADPRLAIKPRDALAKSFELSATSIIELVGKAEAAETIPKAVRVCRGLGKSLDLALGQSRLALRRVRARCRTLAATQPKAAAFVREIQQDAERALRPKRSAPKGEK